MSREDWQKILSSIKRDDWEEAIDLVSNLIVNEPKEPTHFLKLGDFYLEKRNKEAAKRSYVKASELYKEKGQPDKAILALKKALQIDEVDVDLHKRMLELTMAEIEMEELGHEDIEVLEEECDINRFLDSGCLPQVLKGADILETLRKQKVLRFKDGQTIIQEGDTGREVYLVLGGKIRVVTEVEGRKLKIAELQQGDIFGEMAFITHRPRVASVEAGSGGCWVLIIEPEALDDIISRRPEVLKYLYDLYRSRLRES